MKNETIAENLLIAAGICLFGALVHVAHQFTKQKPAKLGPAAAGALFITSGFSGLVFCLIAMLLSENALHWFLATATGSWLGVAGLTKVTDAALDVVLAIAGKK